MTFYSSDEIIKIKKEALRDIHKIIKGLDPEIGTAVAMALLITLIQTVYFTTGDINEVKKLCDDATKNVDTALKERVENIMKKEFEK